MIFDRSGCVAWRQPLNEAIVELLMQNGSWVRENSMDTYLTPSLTMMKKLPETLYEWPHIGSAFSFLKRGEKGLGTSPSWGPGRGRRVVIFEFYF